MDDSKQLVVATKSEINAIDITDYAVSVKQHQKRISVIQEVMRGLMKEGVHYGKIPGCGDRKNLLKDGADLLGATFRLQPKWEITEEKLPGGHLKVTTRCTLVHTLTGNFEGEGIGSASTLESKYRYRNKFTPTADPIPADFWQNKEFYAAQGLVAHKFDGKYKLCKSEKVENDDPADQYNTVYKMSAKRAHIHAMQKATPIGDLFIDGNNFDEIAQTDKDNEKESAILPISSGQLSLILKLVEYDNVDGVKLEESVVKKYGSTLPNLTYSQANTLIEHWDDVAKAFKKPDEKKVFFISKAQVKELNLALAKHEIDIANFCEKFNVTSLAELPIDDFNFIMAADNLAKLKLELEVV